MIKNYILAQYEYNAICSISILSSASLLNEISICDCSVLYTNTVVCKIYAFAFLYWSLHEQQCVIYRCKNICHKSNNKKYINNIFNNKILKVSELLPNFTYFTNRSVNYRPASISEEDFGQSS